jgi:uncharacterized membrane protein
MQLMKSRNLIAAKVAAAAVIGAAMASSAMAQSSSGAVDVTSTVSTISAQLTPIGLVATAILGVFVAIKAYKWVRRALS